MGAVFATITSGELSVPTITPEDAAKRQLIPVGTRSIAAVALEFRASDNGLQREARLSLREARLSLREARLSVSGWLLSRRYRTESEHWPLSSRRDGAEFQGYGRARAPTAPNHAHHRVSGFATSVNCSDAALNSFATGVNSFGIAEGGFFTDESWLDTIGHSRAGRCVGAGGNANTLETRAIGSILQAVARGWD